MIKVRRALISVSKKDGLVDFARGLSDLGVEIISTGGTYSALRNADISVTLVKDVTGFPEILDGRVKTLHPAIFAGILARRDEDSHMKEIGSLGIAPIDLVCVNLYPFMETVAKEGVTQEEAIENIDIGGPSMIRAAAKNFEGVAVVVDPAQYPCILQELRETGGISRKTRFELAVEAFRHTASYDKAISDYLGKMVGGAPDFPEILELSFEKAFDLRYGENPHQRAAFYKEFRPHPASIASARQLHGKELSYNNINDANACLELLNEFDSPSVVAVKHANPCGVGVGDSLAEAYKKAYESDPESIFGGIVGVNRPLDGDTAREMSKLFLEIVLAPEFTPEAFEILSRKKNLRLLQMKDVGALRDVPYYDFKRVSGGLLVQDRDIKDSHPEDARVVTQREPTLEEWADLLFAWKVAKYTKSNAIVLAKGKGTVGIGPGQTSRVEACKIAVARAGKKAAGSALASDAFFPMRDTVDVAHEAGVTAIIQPGGSIKDEESIKACDEYGIAMVFTGVRHFRH